MKAKLCSGVESSGLRFFHLSLHPFSPLWFWFGSFSLSMSLLFCQAPAPLQSFTSQICFFFMWPQKSQSSNELCKVACVSENVRLQKCHMHTAGMHTVLGVCTKPKSIYPVYLDVWMRVTVSVTIHNTGYSICVCGFPPPQEIFRSLATIVPTLRWVVCSLKRKIPVLPKALACSGGITAHCVCMCVCARPDTCVSECMPKQKKPQMSCLPRQS